MRKLFKMIAPSSASKKHSLQEGKSKDSKDQESHTVSTSQGGEKRLKLSRKNSSRFSSRKGSKNSLKSTKSSSTSSPKDKEYINDPLFWGPYLAEREWGTAREDYSKDGSCWDYLSHDESLRQAYVWGEDGLLGISDKFGLLCASLALWNHQDPILKEKLFGLNGNEGNHGEDVKELYYYLDSNPRHSYMRALYRYPQHAFPYRQLVHHGRSPLEGEKEILDTGVFDAQDYWDVTVEYAKPASHSIICRVSVFNHSTEPRELDVIPQFCFRNTWSRSSTGAPSLMVPVFQSTGDSVDAVYEMGIFRINFHHDKNVKLKSLLFTNNNSVDADRAYESPAAGDDTIHCHKDAHGKKDAFHNYIIKGDKSAVRMDGSGTKFCAHMTVSVPGSSHTSVYWQIFPSEFVAETTPQKLNQIISTQRNKTEQFYTNTLPPTVSPEEKNICKQAIAGLLWSKQHYFYNVDSKTKELQKMYHEEFKKTTMGQKHLKWNHLSCQDILLMPDKWEFPWFAAWDMAFHCVQFCRLDMAFAKDQILLLLSDRYMASNGQVPGCEFDFGDTNPPIIAWAVWQIYQRDGREDMVFLNTCFNRLIFSFQWWSKMDATNSYLYGNGFMGLDNISVFDRSKLPEDVASLKQADATGWVGQFALTMLQMSLELCQRDASYTDMAVKFFKHFLSIAQAINLGVDDGGLWMEEDSFFYDVVHYKSDHKTPIRVKSWSGIVPLLACASINLKNTPVVKKFLLKIDRSFAPYVSKIGDNDFFLSLVSYKKLKSMLKIVFNEEEFLSPFGIRSMSKVYQTKPYEFDVEGATRKVRFTPGESDSRMFGGNSNWRGPIWICMNYLFIECLETYSQLDKVFTMPLTVQFPTGSVKKQTFLSITENLCQRIVSLFMPNKWGARPVHGTHFKYFQDSAWESLLLFYEYFHSESGRGCGASHQTGWSGLIVEFIHKIHENQKSKGPHTTVDSTA